MGPGAEEWVDDYELEYREMTQTLADYGGMVPPSLLGGEWSALRAFCRDLSEKPPSSAQERASVEGRIDDILVSSAFNPNYRANLIYQSLQQPQMVRAGPLIEQATFHYYKADYLSCVLLLLPAVEAVLRCYMGLGEHARLRGAELYERLRSAPTETYPGRRSAYADTVATFHERWLWADSRKADFSLSHLNRHYALHALGPKTFYRAIDCHRLFIYFDTFSDMLVLEGYGPKEGFIPIEEPVVARRRDYYFRLLGDPALSVIEARKIELALLAEHPGFSIENSPPTTENVIPRFYRNMGPGEPESNDH